MNQLQKILLEAEKKDSFYKGVITGLGIAIAIFFIIYLLV